MDTPEYKWQKRLLPKAIDIIKKHGGLFIKVRQSIKHDDIKRATDIIILSMDEIRFGCRLLKYEKPWRDLTIRTYKCHYPSELEKIQTGNNTDYYFVAWVDKEDIFQQWMIIDIHKLLQTNLIEEALSTEKENRKDNKPFICIPRYDLDRHNCIIIDEGFEEYESKTKYKTY